MEQTVLDWLREGCVLFVYKELKEIKSSFREIRRCHSVSDQASGDPSQAGQDPGIRSPAGRGRPDQRSNQ